MIVVLLLWLLLIVVGIQYNKKVALNAFCQENAMALRGICAIEIMMGHLGIATGSAVLYPNRKAGILFVGVFFALSGYGLMYSVSNKENYLQGFLRRRLLVKLLLSAYVVFVMGAIVKAFCLGGAYSIKNVYRITALWSETNWYVWELSILYIAFYICAKIDKRLIKSHYFLGIGTLIFVCIAFCVGIDNPWYGSTFCFWIGILYYMKKEIFIERFVRKKFLLKMFACTALLGIAIACFFYYGGIVGNLIARNAASVLFVIIVLMCLHRVSIGNSVSNWLGKYSYEIYLIHPLLIGIMRPWIRNNVIYVLAVIAGTVLIAFIYGEGLRRIIRCGEGLWICKLH